MRPPKVIFAIFGATLALISFFEAIKCFNHVEFYDEFLLAIGKFLSFLLIGFAGLVIYIFCIQGDNT